MSEIPFFSHYTRSSLEFTVPQAKYIPIETTTNSRMKYRTSRPSTLTYKLQPKTNYFPYYTSQQLATIYQLTSYTKDYVNVAIISLGGGFKQSDLINYWNLLGLTTRPNVYSISVNGAKNSPGNDADIENCLDIQTIGGIVPNSNIYVYFAPNTLKGFMDAIQAAAFSKTYPVNTISISWGAPEKKFSSNQLTQFNNLLQQVSNKGITVCVASGDLGSSDGLFGNNVDFPASSPYTLACGGTNLSCPNGVYNSNTTETAWNGSGGGYSFFFSKPNHQNSISGNKRAVPDVSAVADPKTGCIIAYNDNYYVVGGTSLSAPIWAGYLAGQKFNKFITPLLYQKGSAGLHDIISGNNGSYNAKKSWDPVTGLGTPNGSILNQLLLK
jgi:kumamolisin